ncbi:CTLH/CRA C-terminal to lish motif domain-containing protein [Globomyces pollinis-pini]|nr:CTLH/CRA C-terminal to lish motif domain-containing protein [Globomyces pollinis-pini]
MNTAGGDPAAEIYEPEVAPEQKIIHQIIYDYLVHNCYSETATSFGAACKMDDKPVVSDSSSINSESMDIDCHETASASLSLRKECRQLILQGKIRDAIVFCHSQMPGLLAAVTPEATQVRFVLQCQQFIEYVRSNSPQALEFAQNELGSFANENQQFAETLQDVIALLAYPDPIQSPIAHYMSEARREYVATIVNNYLISAGGGNSWTSLERLVQQSTVTRDFLYTEASKDKKAAPKVFRLSAYTLVS